MKYRIGFAVKPKKVEDGIVIFTDGTNEVMPSQQTCQAYGYTWDSSNGVCVLNTPTVLNINKKIDKGESSIGGTDNKTGGAVKNIALYGSNNRLEGQNKNILVNGSNNRIKSEVFDSAIISGSNNIIDDKVNNSTIVSGVGAISIRDNETIIGGFYSDGLDRSDSSSAPFTTQTSFFNMQKYLDAGTGLDYLEDNNGSSIFKTHKNSFLSITVDYLVTGDSLGKISSGTLHINATTDSDGDVVINGSEFTNNNNSSSVVQDKNCYAGTVEVDGVVTLQIRIQAVSGEKTIHSASIKVVETIHNPEVVIN